MKHKLGINCVFLILQCLTYAAGSPLPKGGGMKAAGFI